MTGQHLHSEAQLYRRFVEFAKLMNIYLAHFPKAFAHRDAIAAFLRTELRLELSRATIAPSRRGVNFVGYRAWASRRFVRRHALHTFRLAARAGDVQRIASCLGHARRTSSHARMLRELAARH